MRKLFYIITALFLMSNTNLKGADLLVEEFGIAPAYPSITAAVAAAVDGDRIIIKNRSGGIPWIENITVDKSLEFLSFENDSTFIVQGNYTLVIANNRTITIIGMTNLAGSINNSGTATAKSATVNIMVSRFLFGSINLINAGAKLTLAGNTISDGSVNFVYGNIIGNDITYNGSTTVMYCNNGGTFQNDTVFIIGNKVSATNTSSIVMELASSSSIFYIKNNYVRHKSYGIYFSNSANVALANYIYNNTVTTNSGTSSPIAIYVANIPTAGIVEIMNNVIDDTYSSTSYGIYKGSGVGGQVNVYYNHISSSVTNAISSGFTFSGNNQTGVSITIAADGTITSGTPINGGNPAAPFYDLDLSVGDAGAYGGSFTLNNFFPLHTGPARVFFVNYPYNVRQGSTLNVRANSFDR